MLKKKMAAGVVALAMFSTLGLAACNPGGSSSDSSSGGSTAAGSIPEPDVACDIPAGNLDDSKIDTSKVEGEITFQTQGLQNDFGDFFKAKIKEFEDANPGVKINWTDQGGGAEFDQTVTAQASNCKMADVINVPSSTILALSKSNLLMDYDVKAPRYRRQVREVHLGLHCPGCQRPPHGSALVLRPLHHHLQQGGLQARWSRREQAAQDHG